MYLTEKLIKIKPEKVILNKDPLPWVDDAQHLGNLLNTKVNIDIHCPDTSQDLLIKRGIFFDRIYFAHPNLVSDLLRMYGTSFYGSLIWNLKSKEFQKLTRSWHAAIKIIWDLPHQTHTMFVEALSQCPHLQSTLHSRYVGFAQILSKSNKHHVRLLFESCRHDLRTITGTNLKVLQQRYECLKQTDLFEKKIEISHYIVNELKDEDIWKLDILEELTAVRYDQCK